MSNLTQANDGGSGLCRSQQEGDLCQDYTKPNALASFTSRPILLRSYAVIQGETHTDYLERARYMDALHARSRRWIGSRSEKIVAVAKNLNGEDVFELTLPNGETILARAIEEP